MIRLLVLLALFGWGIHLSTLAQTDLTLTPFSPIVIQGNPNLGRVQPFAMSAVAVRTGIRAWQDAGWTGQGEDLVYQAAWRGEATG
jgi:hypothetical protein